MTAPWIRLPDGWASGDTIAVVDATGCWVWTGCVSPMHGPDSQLHNVPRHGLRPDLKSTHRPTRERSPR